MKSFAGLAKQSSAITENLGKPVPNQTGHQTRASTMKTLLTICLSTVAFALVSLAQVPPPAQAPPATGGTSPGAQAPTNPAAAAQQPPATNLAPGQQPPPAGRTRSGRTTASWTSSSSRPTWSAGRRDQSGSSWRNKSCCSRCDECCPAVAATPEQPAGFLGGNWLIDKFHKGGPIMWPILIVSIVALTVVLERCIWWGGRWFRRDPKRIEKVFTAIENGDTAEASRLSRGSRDPVLRMLWNGLNHQHSSLEAALQVAAGIEIKRAGRFLVVMDTLVTLAPLLGLLGTITGLIRSFSFLGQRRTRCASRHWRYCRSADCHGVRSGYRHFCVDSV